MRKISGLEELLGDYDAMLVDAWGVLHDGASPYPHAIHCLKQLKSAKTPVVLISNAARRVRQVRKELERVGITPDLFDGLVTSGELTWAALTAGIDLLSEPKTAFYLGPERSRSLCEDLDFKWTSTLEEADFVLNTGAPIDKTTSTASLQSMLENMAQLDLPMVCANPDRVAVYHGTLSICAGSIALDYQSLGGDVIWFGKPDGRIFEQAIDELGEIESSRILMVGDGSETDIAGANAVGLDSLLIAGGIHSDDLSPLNNESVTRLAANYQVTPNYFCALFSWAGVA